jgi:hypothetical protein
MQDKKCVVENFMSQAEMLEWAGISFGEQTTILIQKSITKLAQTSGATYMKFFGKVYGLEHDYWVAQGVCKEQEEKPRN